MRFAAAMTNEQSTWLRTTQQPVRSISFHPYDAGLPNHGAAAGDNTRRSTHSACPAYIDSAWSWDIAKVKRFVFAW